MWEDPGVGFFWGLFVKTTVEGLRANTAAKVTSFVSHDPNGPWLGLVDYYDDYPEHLEPDDAVDLDTFVNETLRTSKEAELSEALQCSVMAVLGTNSAPGISVRIFESGRCVRVLDGGEGTWRVRGDAVQPWEAEVVERHLPEDIWNAEGELDADELAPYSALDQRVFRERLLLDGATTPPMSEHDLKLIGVESVMYPVAPIRVREESAAEESKRTKPRGWLARLLGR